MSWDLAAWRNPDWEAGAKVGRQCRDKLSRTLRNAEGKRGSG